jgi:hypothetical protein
MLLRPTHPGLTTSVCRPTPATEWRHIEPGLGDRVIGIVKLLHFRQMRDVAGVNHERRLCWKRFDLANCLLERADGIGIGGFIEADMAVADL